MGDYSISLSSFSVVDNKIEFTIRISKSDGTDFSLNNPIKIENIFSIVQESGAKAKFGKAELKSKYPMRVIDSGFTYNPLALNKSKYFEISITGTKQDTFTNSKTLKITFLTSDNKPESLDYKVFYKKAAPKIIKFEASNYTIQEGSGKKSTISIETFGAFDSWILMRNHKEFKKLDVNTPKYTISENDLDPGINEFNFRLTSANDDQNEVVVCRSLYINKIAKTEVKIRTCNLGTIINFCVSQDGDYLFALVNCGGTIKLAYTDQIEGQDTWYTVEIEDTKDTSIRNYENSPMVHLINEDERSKGELGRIFLVGGSMIGYINEDHAQGVVTLHIGDTTKAITTEIKKTSLPAKVFGHTCIVFPHGTNPHTIWLLGGKDEYGKVTNNVWTSTDGSTWEVQKNANWPARIMPSATVCLNDKKNPSIWLAGGFEDFASDGGVFRYDSWEYDGEKWNSRVKPIDYNNIKAFAIAYGGKESANHTGLVTFGVGDGDPLFNAIEKDNQTHQFKTTKLNTTIEVKSPNQGVIITAYFKQCMWYLRLYDEGTSVNYEALNYRIPTIHEVSLPLFKD
jgi:hypothetical protein